MNQALLIKLTRQNGFRHEKYGEPTEGSSRMLERAARQEAVNWYHFNGGSYTLKKVVSED